MSQADDARAYEESFKIIFERVLGRDGAASRPPLTEDDRALRQQVVANAARLVATHHGHEPTEWNRYPAAAGGAIAGCARSGCSMVLWVEDDAETVRSFGYHLPCPCKVPAATVVEEEMP